jgi:CBS domain-containing protein
MAKENLKKFRVLYNKLDEAIAHKTKTYKRMPFLQKLHKFLDRYPSFQERKNEIKMIHSLRNVIIHEEIYDEEIATPTDSFLKKIRDLIKAIENPQTAIDIATQSIYSCEPADFIIEIVKIMSEKAFSQVPVFKNKDERSGFLGAVSESTITSLVAERGEAKQGVICMKDSMTISNVLNLIKNPRNQTWEFVPKNIDVLKVQRKFLYKSFNNFSIDKEKLGVLFVTKSGQRNEKIEGLITAWDLSKIKT